jgi:hypothetical protein
MSCFEGKEAKEILDAITPESLLNPILAQMKIIKNKFRISNHFKISILLMRNLFLIIFICANIGFNKLSGVIASRISFVIA